MRLADRVCLITGGARGIGRAAALRFIAEGASVIIIDNDRVAGAKTAEHLGCHFVPADVTNQREVDEAVTTVVERFGRVDVLVNNAGYYPLQRFEDISLDDWQRVIAVNLTSVFLCSKAVYPVMRSQGSGKIVNLSSTVAFTGSPLMAHYVAAKAGVVGLTRAMAVQFGPDGITVNALAPGLVLTETVLGDRPISEADARIQLQALKHHGHPEDLVGTLVFLASGDSDFLTGQTIAVDGGRTLH